MAGARGKKPEKDEDVALVLGASEDGETLGVLRKRGDVVEPAVVKKAKEGQPVVGELVRLSPREEPLLYDVDVLYGGQREEADERGGPAQVATEAYRKGWDRLFKKPRRAAPN
ncbi:MAG: hypothetical protein M5U28_50550 [Sandaracinaceae bacterium]|nr:hypothetical protein [Sandaracinaceae bacterium]